MAIPVHIYASLSNHFETLTGVNMCLALEETLVARNKAARICDYIFHVCSVSKKCQATNLKTWIALLKREVEATKSTTPQVQAIPLLLINFFEEKEEDLFRFYGVSILLSTNRKCVSYDIPHGDIL